MQIDGVSQPLSTEIRIECMIVTSSRTVEVLVPVQSYREPNADTTDTVELATNQRLSIVSRARKLRVALTNVENTRRLDIRTSCALASSGPYNKEHLRGGVVGRRNYIRWVRVCARCALMSSAL